MAASSTVGPARTTRLGLAAFAVVLAAGASHPEPAAARPGRIAVPLPLLPAPHVRFPGLFDEQGCALLPTQDRPGRRVCPASPGSSSEGSGRPEGWQRLLGFEGPHYTTHVAGTGVSILPATVGLAAAEPWSVVGMVRNDTPWTIDEVEVSASLEGQHGEHLETVTTVAPVRCVRPGEPAPFALASTTSRDAIAVVRWTTAHRRIAPSEAALRQMEISLVRVLSGVRANALTALGLPPAGDERVGTVARVAWGTIRSWGERPIRKPAVIALWLGSDGRGLALTRARVVTSAGAHRRAPAELNPGDRAEFALAVPDLTALSDEVRPALALWGSPS